MGLWHIQGGAPVVRNVPIFDDGAVMCPLDDAVPLRALLAQRDTAAAQLDAAIDMLQPGQPGERLALGSALHAVLDYLVRPPPPRRCRRARQAQSCASCSLADHRLSDERRLVNDRVAVNSASDNCLAHDCTRGEDDCVWSSLAHMHMYVRSKWMQRCLLVVRH